MQQHVDYLLTKTWTTDAIYRETRPAWPGAKPKAAWPEMEAATLFAVAQFRGVPLGQILYGGDNWPVRSGTAEVGINIGRFGRSWPPWRLKPVYKQVSLTCQNGQID
ncbi:MAG: hypothetical protein U0401_14570 [Anaerolineae bacterium]